MRLIAKKPCNFGGKRFFIGEEVPEHMVMNPAVQEKLGVLAIANDEGVSADVVGTFSQEQVDKMISDAVAELRETEPGAYDGTVQVSVNGESDGEMIAIPVTPEEIQQVFSIMQLTAEEGVKAISDVKSDNVLILLHAADSRKTVKESAKKQADNLFSTSGNLNDASTRNETTDTNKKGADT